LVEISIKLQPLAVAALFKALLNIDLITAVSEFTSEP